jgi:hypothetical protein
MSIVAASGISGMLDAIAGDVSWLFAVESCVAFGICTNLTLCYENSPENARAWQRDCLAVCALWRQVPYHLGGRRQASLRLAGLAQRKAACTLSLDLAMNCFRLPPVIEGGINASQFPEELPDALNHNPSAVQGPERGAHGGRIEPLATRIDLKGTDEDIG